MLKISHVEKFLQLEVLEDRENWCNGYLEEEKSLLCEGKIQEGFLEEVIFQQDVGIGTF